MLSVAPPAIEVLETSPTLFVENRGQWADESVRFVQNGNGANISLTDQGHVMVIDSDIAWSTFLGGSHSEGANGIAVDAAGNAVVTGCTSSTDFIDANNSFHGGDGDDAFVAKVSPEGELLWATYLGGSDGECARGVALDTDGNILVTGETSSTDFAEANNNYHGGTRDAFVAKISPDGELVWARYVGGSGDKDDYLEITIALDADNNAIVAAGTESTDFAGADTYHGGALDAYVAKISPDGELEWARYLGGSGRVLRLK